MAVFNLKETILGQQKKPKEPAAIRNPTTGDMVTNEAMIKKVALQYCVDLLTNCAPEKEYEEILDIKKKLHEQRMNEGINEYIILTESLFNDAFDILVKKGTINTILFWKQETQWNIQIHLGNGRKTWPMVSWHYYSASKACRQNEPWKPEEYTFEIGDPKNIWTDVAKENIIKNMSKYHKDIRK